MGCDPAEGTGPTLITVAPKSASALVARAAGPTVARSSTVTPSRRGRDGVPVRSADMTSVTERDQKFFGSPSLRRAMMFFWISDAPPPMVSMTV